MSTTAVVFGLFGTLVWNPLPYQISAVHCAAADDLGCDVERWTRAYGEQTNTRLAGAWGGLEGWIARTAETRPAAAAVTAAATRYRSAADEFLRQLRPHTVTTLTRLRLAGLQLAVCGDAGLEVVEAFAYSPLNWLVDVVVLSAEHGTFSPDPGLWGKAAASLGTSPENCWFVGDGSDDQFYGAVTTGMTTVQLPTLDVTGVGHRSAAAQVRLDTLADVATFVGTHEVGPAIRLSSMCQRCARTAGAALTANPRPAIAGCVVCRRTTDVFRVVVADPERCGVHSPADVVTAYFVARQPDSATGKTTNCSDFELLANILAWQPSAVPVKVLAGLVG